MPALFVAVLGGCAITPAEMAADIQGFQLPYLPEQGEAVVYVVRPSRVGELVRFNIFVDDSQPESQKASTYGAQYVYFSVPLGEHRILSQGENLTEIKVMAEDRDIIFIRQDSGNGIKMAVTSLSPLDDITGRYQVKNLTLGRIVKYEKKTDY
jgi:hypothetical protein